MYFVEVETGNMTILVDIALAESDGTTYIILFQTLADEYEALHFDVFEPVLAAFEPMASDTGEVVPVATETPIEGDADTDAELTVDIRTCCRSDNGSQKLMKIRKSFLVCPSLPIGRSKKVTDTLSSQPQLVTLPTRWSQ